MRSPDQGSAKFVIFITSVTALGGFLFGYDTAVINGANTFLQKYFGLDPEKHALLVGLATASATLGCIPGAIMAGFLSDRFGRRRMLFFCALLYSLSGILSAIPQTFWQFIEARVLSGVAIGVSSMTCPVYIAEVAPPQWRGRLGSLFQLAIVTGIFVSLFINSWMERPNDEMWNVAFGWRWMLATEVIPAFLFLGLLFYVPESPRWLLQSGREIEARSIFVSIAGPMGAEQEMGALINLLQQEKGSFYELFSRHYRLPLLIAFVLMWGSQFSGINAIMYYSTEIFRGTAANPNAAFMASACIGVVNLLATLIAVSLVDKLGRKPLLLIGNALQMIALLSVGLSNVANARSFSLLGFVILYIAAFAMAMGPLPWIVCSEIFPSKLRGRAMSLATFFIWSGCFIVAQTFPYMLKELGLAKSFLVYAGSSIATFLFVLFLLPETKGRTLEEIETSWKIPHHQWQLPKFNFSKPRSFHSHPTED